MKKYVSISNSINNFSDTGRTYQHKMLGAVIDTNSLPYKELYCKIIKENGYEKIYARSRQIDGAPPFLFREHAIQFVKDIYTQCKLDATNPYGVSQPVLKDLYESIIEKLELYAPGESDQIKAYSTISTNTFDMRDCTPADVYCGIDAFFERTFLDGRKKLVTLDISLRKKDREKTDVTIDEQLPDPRVELDAYLKKIDEYAERFAELLR